MYGLVNQGVKDLVLNKFGEETWQSICDEAGLKSDRFLRMKSYPDDVTYSLVGAASKVLELSPEDILIAFGRHWVLFTAQGGYGDLFDMAGDNLFDFLHQLDELHTRVKLNFPELRTPSFRCTDVKASSLRLEYHSHRDGLSALVVGLLHGLSDRFQTPLDVTHEVKREDTGTHDIFFVSLIEPPGGAK